MHVNTQIDRGLERIIARQEGERIEGLYGLAGGGTVETFTQLEGYLDAIPGGRGHMKLVKRRHATLARRMKKAVPVAKRAMEIMDEHEGDLGSFFSKIGKAIKKVGKVAVKLSPSHYVISKIKPLKNISPAFRVAEGRTPLIAAAVGPPPVTDPAVAAEEARLKAQASADAKAKADAAAAAALQAAQVAPGTPPVQAGAQILQQATGANFTSDQAAELARQVAANINAPGSTMPTASMFSPQPSAGGDTTAADSGGISTPVLIGGGIAAAGLLFLLMRKKRG